MNTIRGKLKVALELTATLSGVAALARRAGAHRVSVLAYHNVVPDAEAGYGEASLHLPLSRFIEQVEHLRLTHDVVDLTTALQPARGRKPRAVLTFDDAYHGAVTLALPELIRRGLPATVFVAPGIIGEPSMWWDELAQAGKLDHGERSYSLHALQGRSSDVRARAFAGTVPPLLPRSYRIATEHELYDHCCEAITIGAHGWYHTCLPALSGQDLRSELERCFNWLNSQDLPWVPWLALPYGEGGDSVVATARDVGFKGVLAIRGGMWNGANAFTLPRINVPAGMTTRGLSLRTSGLLS